jgi:hypothetical protein
MKTSPAYDAWVDDQIGPRQEGGRYLNGLYNSEYEVLHIDRGPREDNPNGKWCMYLRINGETYRSSTPWDPGRDRVIEQPPAHS